MQETSNSAKIKTEEISNDCIISDEWHTLRARKWVYVSIVEQ